VTPAWHKLLSGWSSTILAQGKTKGHKELPYSLLLLEREGSQIISIQLLEGATIIHRSCKINWSTFTFPLELQHDNQLREQSLHQHPLGASHSLSFESPLQH
jgi:hypothetical protein